MLFIYIHVGLKPYIVKSWRLQNPVDTALNAHYRTPVTTLGKRETENPEPETRKDLNPKLNQEKALNTMSPKGRGSRCSPLQCCCSLVPSWVLVAVKKETTSEGLDSATILGV